MLTYKAAYKLTEGIYLGEVLDFPGTVSFGQTLDEAGKNLAGALRPHLSRSKARSYRYAKS